MAFNLKENNLANNCETGFEFELDYLGTPTGAFIKVRGDESKVVREYTRKKWNEMETQKKIAEKRNKTFELSIEELEDLAIEGAAVRVISWKGLADGDDEIEFSKENAQKVLREHTWIRTQVMQNATELTNFR